MLAALIINSAARELQRPRDEQQPHPAEQPHCMEMLSCKDCAAPRLTPELVKKIASKEVPPSARCVRTSITRWWKIFDMHTRPRAAPDRGMWQSNGLGIAKRTDTIPACAEHPVETSSCTSSRVSKASHGLSCFRKEVGDHMILVTQCSGLLYKSYPSKFVQPIQLHIGKHSVSSPARMYSCASRTIGLR